MPSIIPDTLPSNASQSERQLFNILSTQLPDNFIVWYEPRVKDLYPDFVILGPKFGLLILEVKGWYAGQVERANNNFFDIRWQHNVTKSPSHQRSLKRDHGYFRPVVNKLREYSDL